MFRKSLLVFFLIIFQLPVLALANDIISDFKELRGKIPLEYFDIDPKSVGFSNGNGRGIAQEAVKQIRKNGEWRFLTALGKTLKSWRFWSGAGLTTGIILVGDRITDAAPDEIVPSPNLDEKLGKYIKQIQSDRTKPGKKSSYLENKIFLAEIYSQLPDRIEKKLDRYIRELAPENKTPADQLVEAGFFGSFFRGITTIMSYTAPPYTSYKFYRAMTDPPPDVIIDSFVRMATKYCSNEGFITLLGGKKVITINALIDDLFFLNKDYSIKTLVKIFANLDPDCLEEVFYIGGPLGKKNLENFSQALEEKFDISGADLESLAFWLQQEVKKDAQEQLKQRRETAAETRARHAREEQERIETQEYVDRLMKKYPIK